MIKGGQFQYVIDVNEGLDEILRIAHPRFSVSTYCDINIRSGKPYMKCGFPTTMENSSKSESIDTTKLLLARRTLLCSFFHVGKWTFPPTPTQNDIDPCKILDRKETMKRKSIAIYIT